MSSRSTTFQSSSTTVKERREISLIVCLDDANLLHYNNTLGDVVNSLLRLHQDYPGARAAVFATVSDMDLDLASEPGMRSRRLV